ncbi:MAG TPA: hypothetical protein PLP21_10175 [Pyrinomonadaceae bacterium]|nr:hypothetical protein [Pyrinomonadaceae bacterium]
MNGNTYCILVLFCLLLIGGVSLAPAQALDISSGGSPTITGALSGSVSGSSSVLNNLSVTVDFGEVSPLNTNNIVKVVVPIAVRSNQPYRVRASLTTSTNANPQAVQTTDIGFGVNNFRAMGSNSRVCTRSSHIFYSPFNNDPSSGVTINASGRAQYPSDLSDIVGSTTILSGPRLSNGGASRATNDGYIFDAILVITPQFYAPGTTTAVITFTISAGPAVPC